MQKTFFFQNHYLVWIFVTDHCQPILKAFEAGKTGEIYNIGARNTKTNLEVITTILDKLGKPHSLIKKVTDRLGHDRRYAIDPSKIENKLGWKAKVSWEEGLQKTIDWYVENAVWVDRIKSSEYKDYYRNIYAKRLNV